MTPQRSVSIAPLSCLGLLSVCAGWVLLCRNLFFSADHSWWLIGGILLLVGPFLHVLSRWYGVRTDPPSDAAIENAFARYQTQQLRSIVIPIPEGWKYRKVGRGAHMFTVAECGHQAAIVIELTYLNETEINTLEGYLAYAAEFVRNRKSSLLFNKITRRWGMAVHEFADESTRTAGHRVTAPYHGTEYGFQLRLSDVRLAPAARRLFEKFLEHIRFAPPELILHSMFGGSLSVGLPREFQSKSQTDPNTVVWVSTVRQDCTVEITRLKAGQEGLSPMLLSRFVRRCPRPAQAEQELSKSRMTTLGENGFGGYIYFQASEHAGLFAAVGDLLSGGRYVFCLDDKDPRQEPYCETYFYQQISYEILVTMCERISRR